MGRRTIHRHVPDIADTVSQIAINQALAGGGAAGTGIAFGAACVVTANTSLAAFVGVAGGSTTNSDGVTNSRGNIVLLVAQATPSQNGPYVVGVVSGGSAPLTRPTWWQNGSIQTGGTLISIATGSVYKNTLWSAMNGSPSFTVGATDPQFYPYEVSFACSLIAGAMTAGVGATAGAPLTLPVFSATSYLLMTRKTANTSAATIMYAQNGAPTPGPPGTGAISAFATIANGTINANDISTLSFNLVNQL